MNKNLILVKLNGPYWVDVFNRDRSKNRNIETITDIEDYIQEYFSDILGEYYLEHQDSEVYVISENVIDCINCQ
jgi:hypothetical protein